MSTTMINKLRKYRMRIEVERGRIHRWQAEAEGLRLDHPWPLLPPNLDSYLSQLEKSDPRLYREARELASVVEEYRKSHSDHLEGTTNRGKER
jgi:hypothetical protein